MDLSVAWIQKIISKKYSMEKGKKNNLIVKKPDKHYLSQVIKVNTNNHKAYW